MLALFKKLFVCTVFCVALAACESSEERAARHFASGMELLEAGDSSRAVVEFRNTLKYNETHVEARRQIAFLSLAAGNLGEGYRNFLAVVEQEPNDLEGRVTLSKLAFQLKNWDEFDRHGKAAFELAPDVPEVKAIDVGMRYRQAVVAEDSALRGAILIEAETQNAENPENPVLRQVLIDGYVSQERFEEALAELDKSIDATPDNLDLYNGRLRILSRLGRNDELEAEMREMVDLFPEDPSIKGTLLRFLISRQEIDKAEDFLRELVDKAPEEDKTAARTTLVQFLLETKGGEAARAELDAYIAADPKADILRVLRASLIFDAGQRDEAIAELEEIVGAEQPNIEGVELQNAKVSLARMLLGNGNEVGSRRLIAEILEEDTRAVGALKMQAAWQIQDDDTDGAISGLRIALDQSPQDAEAMTLMAQAYQRAGNKDLMLNFLSLAVEASNAAPRESLRYARALSQEEEFLQAETTLIAALRLSPGNQDLLAALGQVYLRLPDMPRAQQVVETLRRIDTERSNANANAIELEILAQNSGTDEALAFLEDLAREDTDNAALKLAVVRSHLQNGDAEKALSSAQELVDENPENLSFKYMLAMTHASTRDYDTAETQFEELLEDNPQAANGWLQLSRLHVLMGDRAKAATTIDRGLEAIPDSPDLLWGKASFLQRDGDIDGAIEIYESLYERSSSSTIIANNLASLLATYRNDTESLTRAEVIARRFQGTDVPALQDTYGWIQFRNGNFETALEYLEPAATGLPNDAIVQLHLAMTFDALERSEEALAQFRKAVGVAGEIDTSPEIEAARARITELEAAAQE